MAGNSVAVTGEVVATPGTTPFTGANPGGSWTAGSISMQTYGKLTIGDQPVMHGASCTFSFSGTTGTGAPISGSEVVTLTAGTTVLQKGQSGVLVQGNSATGTFGNTLAVQTARKLTTA
jgi:hypothetical protein